MSLQIVPATAADLPDIAIIFAKAMAADPFWRAMNGPDCTFEEECAFYEQRLRPRVGAGAELGACQTWKVIDEDGKMVAWAGLGAPVPLTAEQRASLQAKFDSPSGGNESLTQWFKAHAIPALEKHGYDPSKHFQRQTTMVLPGYQRRGIGRALTEKLNAIADEGGAPTYVRARPGAAGLFIQMGYETLDRLDFDLADFGVELGGKETKTAIFVMRRLPGAKDEKGARLDWS